MEHEMLVSAGWLAARVGTVGAVVVDASVFLDPAAGPAGSFVSGAARFVEEPRIPGARFADLFTRFSDRGVAGGFNRPDAVQFADDAAALGFEAQDHVVIYDKLSGQWAARLWWVLRSHGHQRVSVLNGGYRAYRAGGYPLEAGPPAAVLRADYRAGGGAGLAVATTRDVLGLVQSDVSHGLVCLLQADDFYGAQQVRARAGVIPGSVNLPFSALLDPVTKALLPPDTLRARFEAVVPLDGRRIVTYCGGGIASTVGALALAVIGYTNTAEYDGSLQEWGADAALPLVQPRR